LATGEGREASLAGGAIAETDVDISSDKYGSSGSAKTYYCKVKVIASPAGIVTKLTTEDSSGTGGLLGLAS
jgi:hypothetical protein